MADRLAGSESSLAENQSKLAAMAADLDARAAAADKAGGEAGALERDLAEAKAAHAKVSHHTYTHWWAPAIVRVLSYMHLKYTIHLMHISICTCPLSGSSSPCHSPKGPPG